MNKINMYKALIYTMLINVFFSLINKILPSMIPMGKIMGFIQIIIIIYMYVNTLKKNDVFVIFFLIIVDMITIYRIDNISIDMENLVFFTSTCLLLWKFSENKVRMRFFDEFKKNEKKIIKFAKILLLFSVILLLYKKSWSIVNGIRVYLGLCNSGHKLSGNMCFLGSIFLLYFIDKKMKISDFIYFLIPFLIILLTGSRTYFVSYLFILMVIYITKLKEYKLKVLIIPIILAFGTYLIINSSIIDRFFTMGNNKYVSDNFLEATSSGRLIWWEIDYNDFKTYNLINKIFGKGYTYLHRLNLLEYGLAISAHNDFLTLLIGNGLFAILGYIIILLRWFFKDKHPKSILLNFIPVFLLMFNACISGFYGAQQYLFANIIISVVIYYFNNNMEKKNG